MAADSASPKGRAYFESPSSRDLTAVAPIITRFPNKPLVEGIVDAGLLPNRPPAAGAAVLVFVVPISPPVAGVVEAPPNRPPAEVVGVTDEEAAAFWPPKRDPGGLVAGVVALPKENLGAPDVVAALPNNPPPAGAVLVMLLSVAPEELGVENMATSARCFHGSPRLSQDEEKEIKNRSGLPKARLGRLGISDRILSSNSYWDALRESSRQENEMSIVQVTGHYILLC